MSDGYMRDPTKWYLLDETGVVWYNPRDWVCVHGKENGAMDEKKIRKAMQEAAEPESAWLAEESSEEDWK